MHFSSSGETPVVTRLVCASWTSRARIRNGSDEWTGEGTSFGVKCVFDGVVISPELFHRRLIGNVDERPLRFPAYRIPASRIARTTRELDSFFSLSLSPFFSFAFDFFFFPLPFSSKFRSVLPVDIAKSLHAKRCVWFLILRATVCDSKWKEGIVDEREAIENITRDTSKKHFTNITDSLQFYGYRKHKRLIVRSSSSRRGGMKNSASSIRFRNWKKTSKRDSFVIRHRCFNPIALTNIYAFTWYYASVTMANDVWKYRGGIESARHVRVTQSVEKGKERGWGGPFFRNGCRFAETSEHVSR